MDDFEDFVNWSNEINNFFRGSGYFWEANSDFLTFMYQDDATPEEVFNSVMNTYGR